MLVKSNENISFVAFDWELVAYSFCWLLLVSASVVVSCKLLMTALVSSSIVVFSLKFELSMLVKSSLFVIVVVVVVVVVVGTI